MRCINNTHSLYKKIISVVLAAGCILLSACGYSDYSVPHGTIGSLISSEPSPESAFAEPFSADLCVYTGDVLKNEDYLTYEYDSAVLINAGDKVPIYSRNAFQKLYPASLTKIMTALLAIKYGQPDQVLVASSNVRIDDAGAQKVGISEGDSMTLSQALRLLLLHSANDVAVLIAENIAGSLDEFVRLMNNEAARLGATGTHFTNPHGLHDEDHYTTAYDMYLIFNECIKYDEFKEIISMSAYETTYRGGSGREISVSVKNTNGYISGTYFPPQNISVIGGKTGTTQAAGHCLILYSKDAEDKPYISVVMKAVSTEDLYGCMTKLLGMIEQQ